MLPEIGSTHTRNSFGLPIILVYALCIGEPCAVWMGPPRPSILKFQLGLTFRDAVRAHAERHLSEYLTCMTGPPPPGMTRSIVRASSSQLVVCGFFPVQDLPLHFAGAAGSIGAAAKLCGAGLAWAGDAVSGRSTASSNPPMRASTAFLMVICSPCMMGFTGRPGLGGSRQR